MTRRIILSILFLAVGYGTAQAQVRSVYDQGAGGLARVLRELQTIGSVMHTGAHPDDEDSALVAYHARAEGARTAYLSLTRGAGGQNIIGTEQSDLLGIIRTEELLQARRLDGASQYFTSAVDFGFSKALREAATEWDEETILRDMALAIRRFRPVVAVSRWDGTPADGHGHHQFSGYITPLAIEAAADPTRFPEQVAAGHAAWQVRKLFLPARDVDGSDMEQLLVTDTGVRDPVAGRSYFQIGMQGRSQQKTQQMGSLELTGRQVSLLLLDQSSEIADSSSLFAGIDVSLKGIAYYEADASSAFVAALAELDALVSELPERFRPFEPAALLPQLGIGRELAITALELARSPDSRRLLEEKIAAFEHAMLLAAGISVDVFAAAETLTPGSTLAATVRLYRGTADVELVGIEWMLPAGWQAATVELDGLPNEIRARRRDQPDDVAYFELSSPPDADVTSPYWLKRPHDVRHYDWTDAGNAATEAFGDEVLAARLLIDVGGQRIAVERPLQYRQNDRVRGEIRRRVDVVPKLTVNPASDLEILRLEDARDPLAVTVAVANQSSDATAAAVSLEVPEGWSVSPAAISLNLPAGPASLSATFMVSPGVRAAAGSYDVQAVVASGDDVFRDAIDVVAYPHIRTHRRYRPAAVRVELIDVETAPVSVAYIMGSGDTVPEAIARLGVDVTELTDTDLATGDLDRFDTIVVGIRASQTRPAFAANNERLLEFARRGGALIVQYQQRDYIEQGLQPFHATMGERTVRVVNERAPVEILVPEHPVFSFPNTIGAADFEGWVQERNNYNFVDFDEQRYVALLESHDDGEPESRGGMVYARIGDGHYIYSGYSWFRQLPRGIPGAYRIFANLLSLPESDE